MPPAKSLMEIALEKYDDKEIAEMVVKDAEDHKTVQLILAGECTLPHPEDARRHYHRLTGQDKMTATERSQAALIKSQDERLARLEEQLHALQNPPKPEGK